MLIGDVRDLIGFGWAQAGAIPWRRRKAPMHHELAERLREIRAAGVGAW
jgi:hypothetical protein